MTRLALSLLFALAPTLVHAQTAPEVSNVRGVLCASMEIASGACAASRFDRVGELSLRRGETAWVFVLTDGGPEPCHVRHACFSIVARQGRRWVVPLSSAGQTVRAAPRRGRADLIVTASASSEQYDARRYRWDGSRYDVVERATCAHDAAPRRGHVCDAFRDSVPLQ